MNLRQLFISISLYLSCFRNRYSVEIVLDDRIENFVKLAGVGDHLVTGVFLHTEQNIKDFREFGVDEPLANHDHTLEVRCHQLFGLMKRCYPSLGVILIHEVALYQNFKYDWDVFLFEAVFTLDTVSKYTESIDSALRI